jgi:hypothetical protein
VIPPEAPDIPIEYVKALINYSAQYVRYQASELADAQAHGLTPSAEGLAALAGYEFTALFLSESYDLPTPG